VQKWECKFGEDQGTNNRSEGGGERCSVNDEYVCLYVCLDDVRSLRLEEEI
jgi:hypothetical protein